VPPSPVLAMKDMKKSQSDHEQAASRFETWCGRIFIRAVMILLPLLVLDYFSPLFWFHRRSEIEREFPVQVVRKPKPYTMFGGEKNGTLGEDIVLNERGYRGKSPSVPKPAGEFRVFVLGGSTVFVGEPPVPDLVEEQFRDSGSENVKVYNYAVVSSVSSMELSRIVYEISDLEPDLIVMYNGGNDILHPYEYDPRPGYPFNFIVYENNPLLESDVRSYPTFNLLLYGSNLARSFFPHYFLRQFVPMKKERQEAGWGSDEWRDEIGRRYVSNLVKAGRIADAFGAGFIAFFQPMIYYKDPLAAEEKNDQPDPELQKHCLNVRQTIFEQIQGLDRELAPLVVDLSDIYDDVAAAVFIDEIHTKQENKVAVAEAMHQHIVRNFRIE
jgi:hypothetical protein